MEEYLQNDPIPAPREVYTPPVRQRSILPAGGKELVFALAALITGLLLCNFVLFGGFNLGFAIGMDLSIAASALYLMLSGHRLTPYSAMLLLLSLVIGAGFARSDDGFVKLVMLGFLFFSVNLGLTLLAGQQRHPSGGLSSLLDSFYTGFCHSFGKLFPAFSGLMQGLTQKGEAFRKGGAIALGLAIAVPVVLVMTGLLMQADAAFEGLMVKLPALDLGELPVTLVTGLGAFCLIYSKGISLQHSKKEQAAAKERRGISRLTVNTVLIAVCGVYLMYLFSQLAYFVGGFAGILPADYTMAEYARRGFFEMAWLCGINLGLIGLCMGLVEKKAAAPLLTRLLCLFVGIITVFFVATAIGKMLLYIDAYGLTRLRVLTLVIMLWLCLTTVFVALWLFLPKLPYMKGSIAAGLILGALVLWADVDSHVARHNVNRYLEGSTEHIDVSYLWDLDLAAVPYIAKLAESAPDAEVRQTAGNLLEGWYVYDGGDFRSWNYTKHSALPYLAEEPTE